MPLQSTLLFGVPLILGLCSYSCSLDVIPHCSRPCCSVLHLALANTSSDNKKHLDELLHQAGMDPEQSRIEPLEGPGFCNALYRVQCGNEQVRSMLFETTQDIFKYPYFLMPISRWSENCFPLLQSDECLHKIDTLSIGWHPNMGSAQSFSPRLMTES